MSHEIEHALVAIVCDTLEPPLQSTTGNVAPHVDLVLLPCFERADDAQQPDLDILVKQKNICKRMKRKCMQEFEKKIHAEITKIR